MVSRSLHGSGIQANIVVTSYLSAVIPAFHIISFNLRDVSPFVLWRVPRLCEVALRSEVLREIANRNITSICNITFIRKYLFSHQVFQHSRIPRYRPHEDGLWVWSGICCAVSCAQASLTAVEVRTFDLNIYTACELGQLFPLNKTSPKCKSPDGLSQSSLPPLGTTSVCFLSFLKFSPLVSL